MDTAPLDPAETEATPAPRGLRWWQWLVLLLPGIVSAGTTFVLTAMERAKDEASGFTYLSDYDRQHMMLYMGLAGISAGAICCVAAGLCLGLTTQARHPLLACLGWTVLSALVGLPLSFVGCGMVESAYRPK